ncbi:MAG: aminotransferase class I/II-fold pyridoxal phosphate-dependent enzyme [Cyclobacteriaceae bacterium]|nr:aminotransferase class I/II-fold pyridoxal phosphate-dependent enzyme [Cyclobacteriaceae bacterium]
MIIKPAERLSTTKEYYFSVKLQEVRALMAKGRKIINVAIGNPDMAPSQATIDALTSNVGNPDSHGYQPYRGIPEFRGAIGKFMADVYGVSLNINDEILPLIGSKEGITHVSLAFLNPGDKALVPELGYPAYSAVTDMVGGMSIPYPMMEQANWRPDIKAIENMNLAGVKLMWINYPNMPTGAPASREAFQEIIDFAKKRQILIVHDNPYSLVLNETPPLSILSLAGAMDVALEMNSMSKSHNMAGWRIGWIAGSKAYIDTILQIKSNVDSGMFKPMQLAAVEAFANSSEWHTARNDEYRRRRTLVWKILDKLSCSYDRSQTGMFIWAHVPDAIGSAEKLSDYLLYELDIFVTPGFVFGAKGAKYIRISLSVKYEMLEEVLQRLENFDLGKI